MVLVALMFISKNLTTSVLTGGILLTDAEKLWIRNNTELKAIVGLNFKPISYVEGGEAKGFSVDYLNLIAEKLGINIEYVYNSTWEGSLELIRSGDADIAHSVSLFEERTEYLNFTEEYLNLPMLYIGRLGADEITIKSDLDGKRIGLIDENTSTLKYIEMHPELEFVKIKTNEDALIGLSTGLIDVLIINQSVAVFNIAITFNNGVKILGQDFLLQNPEADRLRLAATKREPILISILTKGMNSISEQEFADISRKWTIENINNYDVGLTIGEKIWLSENNIIKVGAASSDYPIQFINESGELDGIAGSFLNEISKRLNVKFEWSGETSLSERLLKIQTSEIDIISYITPLVEREEFLDFTDNYIMEDFVIYARDDSFSFYNIESLNGHTIAQTRGTQIVQYVLENYPEVNIIEVDNTMNALRLVSTGQAEAYISNIPTTTSFISSSGLTNLSVTGITPFSEINSIGISRDLPLLSSSIQKAFNDIDFKTRNEILNYWLTSKDESSVDYRPFGYFFSVAMLICIILLIWNKKLMVAKLDETSVELEETPYLKKVNLFDT